MVSVTSHAQEPTHYQKKMKRNLTNSSIAAEKEVCQNWIFNLGQIPIDKKTSALQLQEIKTHNWSS